MQGVVRVPAISFVNDLVVNIAFKITGMPV